MLHKNRGKFTKKEIKEDILVIIGFILFFFIIWFKKEITP